MLRSRLGVEESEGSTGGGADSSPHHHGMMSTPRLKDKVAIVPGSSSGIGKAIALRFGREGAKVIVAARRLQLCEQTVSQIKMQGGEASAIQTDVTDERQVERLIADTVAHQRLCIFRRLESTPSCTISPSIG